jgi:uncharacterized protein DUF2510
VDASVQPPTDRAIAAAGPPLAVQQTTIIQVGARKSVAGAVLLALFFGPIGMIYATVAGALVMLVVNLFMIFATFGIGLLVTVPLGALWAGISASSHNRQLGAMSSQAIAAVPPAAPATAPAGWHDDPEGGQRLRYWDGSQWTGHYADHPLGEGQHPAIDGDG